MCTLLTSHSLIADSDASCAKLLPPTSKWEKDKLRDDGIVYGEDLKSVEVQVRVDCMEGHATFSIFPNPEELESKCTDGIGWLLGRKRLLKSFLLS